MEAEQVTSISLILKSNNAQAYSASRINSFGPLLQGALMEMCDVSYARYLHALPFNPYSQSCVFDDQKNIVWTLSTLNKEAEKHLIAPLLHIGKVELRAINETFSITRRTLNSIPLQSVLGEIKTSEKQRHRIGFISPTAFKSQGEYVFMPTSRLIFQNLFMHYNQVYANGCEVDEETVSYLAQNVRISAYNVRSRYFSCSAGGRTKIPAFVGTVTIDVNGKQPLRGLVSMLLRFGEFSGVGIKTSMGMGRICSIPLTEEHQERTRLGQ